MNENVTVSLIVDGGFMVVTMPQRLLSELAIKLRKEGDCPVHLAEKSVIAEGFAVLAKGSKHALMVIPNAKEVSE